MTVIDDITALLTPVLHTNTTKDITAAAVKTALISAFTAVVDDEVARATANSATIAAGLSSISDFNRFVHPVPDKNLYNGRNGQRSAGYHGATYMFGNEALVDNRIDNTGTVSSATDWTVSGYLPVTPGGSLTLAGLTTAYGGSPPAGLCFYDGSKTYISSINLSTATEGQVVSVPSTAQFIRFPVKGSIGSAATNTYDITDNAMKMQVLDGNVATVRHRYNQMPSTVNMHRPWTDKVWFVTGDSLASYVEGNFWVKQVAEYHGCRYLKNEARAGGTAATLLKYGNNGFSTDNTALPTTYFDDVDCTIVVTGVNDTVQFSLGTPLGTIDDATTAATFYGYYKKFIEFALTHKPYHRMILAIPGYRGTDDPANINSIRTAIRAMAYKYSIKIWNMGEESQMSPFTNSVMTTDGSGIHPAYPNNPFLDTAAIYGSTLQAHGSMLRGFMHTVPPVDYLGDPTMGQPRP